MFQKTLLKTLRFILFPFSLLYALVVAIRNVFFDIGFFNQTSFDIPVIAVGNLSVGGTGKTPQIEYYIRLLQNDYNVAVLSRGYKRLSKGFVLANDETKVEEIGDEPYQFFKKFPKITVAVDADRRNGIEKLMRLEPAINLILLDDAFQHRKVKASFYTLLTSYDNRYTKDFVLPTGTLRELRSGAKRANNIIVTKCPVSITDIEKNKIISEINPKNYQKVFFSSIVYDAAITSSSKDISLDLLKEYSVVLVTGIANPKPMLQLLENEGVNYNHIEFPDHHNFKSKDIEKIKDSFERINNLNKLVLTTEKDYTRLSEKIDNLYSLGIQTTFFDNKVGFDANVKSHLTNFK